MILIFCISFLTSGLLLSQSYEQGYKDFYNRNYNKALSAFEKVVSSDPNNEYAQYYLGQTYIKLGQLDVAKQTYELGMQNKKLSKSGLLLVGKGHVTLLNGDSVMARAIFEEAITLSRSKDENVFGAIGYANLEKRGNLNYATDVLRRATQTKRFSNPKIYITLGYVYKKLLNGSKSVQAFNNATRMDSKEAEAYFQVGKIFATQNNIDVYLKNYYSAVAANPSFAPVYFELYGYYFNENKIDSAKKYLGLYERYLEQSEETQSLVDLFKAELSFLQKDFAKSMKELLIIRVDNASRLGKIIERRVLRVKALNYEGMQKPKEAFSVIQQYNKKLQESDDDVEFSDMFLYIRLLVGTDDTTKEQYFMGALKQTMAISNDVSVKLSILRQIGDICEKAGYAVGYAKTKIHKLSVSASPSDNDHFEAGYTCFSAGLYNDAARYLKDYVAKQPKQPFGYFWLANTNLVLDSSYESSKPYFEKYIDIAGQDIDKNKQGLIKAYTFMGGYYTKNKDYIKAIKWWEELLNIDPKNVTAKNVKKKLVSYQKKMADYNKRKEEYERRRKEMQEE